MKDVYRQYKKNLTNDFSIQHKITTSAEINDFHIHDAFEIMLVRSSNVKCFIGEKSYHIEKNSLILFNNMDLHLLLLDKVGEYDRYVLYFRPEYIATLSSSETDLLECFFFRPFPDPQILCPAKNELSLLLHLLDKICVLQKSPFQKIYGQDLFLKFLLGELLLHINGIYRSSHHITNDNFTASYRLIYALINFIHQNLAEDLSLEKLAQHFFINKYHLCVLFKKVTGTSPSQYIIHCRMIKAKELLSHKIPVETVCGLIGYNNLSHFSRTFKRHTGSSPKKFSLHAAPLKT